MFKDALKKSTFVQNICDTVNYWFPRDSIFYAYRTRDLIMMRLTRLACGLPDFIDGVQFKHSVGARLQLPIQGSITVLAVCAPLFVINE